MDLGSFLADDTFGGGSWADEEVDLNTIGVSLETPSFAGSTAAPIGNVGGGTILHQQVLVLDPVLVLVLVMMNSKEKEKNFLFLINHHIVPEYLIYHGKLKKVTLLDILKIECKPKILFPILFYQKIETLVD